MKQVLFLIIIIIIIIIMLLSGQYCCLSAKTITVLNKQEPIIYSEESINRFNEKIVDLLRTSFCKPQIDSVYIYPIYHFNTSRNMEKYDLLDSTFFRKLLLLPDYDTYSGYINSSAIILDANNDFIGIAEPDYVYCKKKYNASFFCMEEFLIRKRKDLDIQAFFTFKDNLFISVVYGKNHNNKIYAFYRDETKIFRADPIDEFISKYNTSP